MNSIDYNSNRLKNLESPKKNTLSDMIKKQNFEYGCSQLAAQNPYKTISNIIYNDKGNQSKATLNIEKSNDLKTNHFTVGGGTANI